MVGISLIPERQSPLTADSGNGLLPHLLRILESSDNQLYRRKWIFNITFDREAWMALCAFDGRKHTYPGAYTGRTESAAQSV